jgi:hypothetical protein
VKSSVLTSALACFLVASAFLILPGHAASVSTVASVSAVAELPGEEVIVLPDGRYVTPSELADQADSLRRQDKIRNDAGKSRGKEKNRGKGMRNTASIGPGYDP